MKRFHSDRIGGQMARVDDVVAVQGKRAVEWLARLIRAAAGKAAADPLADAGKTMDRKEIADRLRVMAKVERYNAQARAIGRRLGFDYATVDARDADALEAAADIVGRDG